MITGEIRSQVDRVWDAFWSGGISNPLEVIEQITYLLFLRRLDDLHTLEESKANRLKKPMARRVFPEGKDPRGRSYEELRWSRLKNMEAKEMYTVVAEHVFPFLRTLGGDGSTYAGHMKDARFTIPTPALLARVVDMLDHVPMEERDTKGDLYEYMLGKIASAGQNGQFRTPRHIIQLMVELMAPGPQDVICDPACGTAGFLVAASEYVREHYPEVLRDPKLSEHFHHGMFHGYDFDATMLRIGSMNMLLHGVENPDIQYRDSLAQDHSSEDEKYTLILANPPFAGSLDYEGVAKDLLAVVKTKKTELLFLALLLRLLKPGGRAAVVVPEGVIFGSSSAHRSLRKMLVENQKLEAVISLPSGVFKPYAGVSTAILVFTKTDAGGTDCVWFYDCQADGYSLDDRRAPLVDESKLGATPSAALQPDEHQRNNLPDLLARWLERSGKERSNSRTAQSFCVPWAEIADNGYDLSFNRYRTFVDEVREQTEPATVLLELAGLEQHVGSDLAALSAAFSDVHTRLTVPRESWKTLTLAEACEKITDGTHHSPPIVEVGVPYITAKHLKRHGLDFDADPWFVSHDDHREIYKRCDPKVGDVLYIKDGATTGIAAVNKYEFEFSMLSSLALLRPRRELLLPEFLSYWLNDPNTQRQMLGSMAGAAIRRLTLAKIKAVAISIPPLEVQRVFVSYMAKVESMKEAHRAAIRLTDKFAQSLQDQMFLQSR